MSKRTALAIHGGTPVKTTAFGSGPKHNLREWQAIRPVFERGNIHMTRGPEVMALRRKFCELFGMKHAVTTSSGTSALHTALGALEIGRGDEVITSPITDMGTVTAIVQQNAVPVFADVDPATLMITPATVKAKLTPRTRAVLPVHLAGHPCDVRGIKALTKGRNIGIVEDMAQSYLTRQGKRLSGTIGDIGCWSLNESKHIGAGDGGILLTNSRALARRADLFADKCYNREGGPTDPFFAPYNYRLNTLTAAVCLEQLKRVKRICEIRNKRGDHLNELLADVPGVVPRPVRRQDYATYWYYIFLLDPEIIKTDLQTFCAAVQAEGVYAGNMHGSTVLRWSIFRNPPDDRHACGINCPHYRGTVDYRLEKYPGVQNVLDYAVRLGISEHFTMADIRDTARAVRKVAAHYAEQ